jgi:hypothetical protein
MSGPRASGPDRALGCSRVARWSCPRLTVQGRAGAPCAWWVRRGAARQRNASGVWERERKRRRVAVGVRGRVCRRARCRPLKCPRADRAGRRRSARAGACLLRRREPGRGTQHCARNAASVWVARRLQWAEVLHSMRRRGNTTRGGRERRWRRGHLVCKVVSAGDPLPERLERPGRGLGGTQVAPRQKVQKGYMRD